MYDMRFYYWRYSMKKKNTERVKSKLFYVLVLFFIISVACSAFAIYELWLLSSIETTFRYIIIGTLSFIDGILLIKLRFILLLLKWILKVRSFLL